MITVEQYNQIKGVFKPLFIVFLLLFLLKEISFIFNILLFSQLIPDWVFLVVFLIYATIDFLPYFGHHYIEGYEPPEPQEEDELLQEEEDEEVDLDKLSI